MTLRQFEYVIAVAEEGSFTVAARRLAVSQPALSHQIRDLERSLGGDLFERLPRAVRLTPRGRAFLPHATSAVIAAREAALAARAVGRMEAGELRIATLQSMAVGLIPPAVRAWRRLHPRMQVAVREFSHVDLLTAAMAQGAADVAVGPRTGSWPGPAHPLGAEEFLVVLPAGDPLLGPGPVPLAALADRPWVLYAPEFGLSAIVAAAFRDAGLAPVAAARTHHTATAVELAAAGLGPALAPGNVISPEFRSLAVRPDPPIRRELAVFTRPDPAPAAAAFMTLAATEVRP